MIEQIFSLASPGTLLHLVVRPSDEGNGFRRTDLVPEDAFLQAALIELPGEHTFPPHCHVFRSHVGGRVIAQESWVVVRGSVRCEFFDLDDTHLRSVVLEAGDASFTLQGGHTYVGLAGDSLVYEYKSGPYLGPALDKRRFAYDPKTGQG